MIFVTLIKEAYEALMRKRTWTVAEAKAKFSELMEKANSEGPQKITKRGRTTAVVVAAEEWERKSERKGNLAEFLASSPLRGSALRTPRLPMRLRKVVSQKSLTLSENVPQSVLLSLRDYLCLAAREPEVLRIIGQESKRKGTRGLRGKQINQVIKAARKAKRQ